MSIESTHWSKDRKTFGINISDDLQCNTLEDVQDELAEAGMEVERGETQVLVTQEDEGGICVGSIVRFPNGDLQSSTRKTQVRSSDGGKTWSKFGKSLFGNYACNLSDGETVQFASRTGHGWEVAPPDEMGDKEHVTEIQVPRKGSALLEANPTGLLRCICMVTPRGVTMNAALKGLVYQLEI